MQKIKNMAYINPYALPTQGTGNYEIPYAPTGVNAIDTSSGNAVVEPADSSGKKFNWGSVMDLGGSLIENSGQLASVFSNKYRQDQIELAQNQSFFTRNAPTFGATPEQRKTNQNLIAIVAVSVVVILIMVFILKKK